MDGLAPEADIEPVVDHALTLHAGIEPERRERLDRARLQHAGTHPAFDIGPTARLQDHRLVAGLAQQMREKQSCRPSSDDSDLGAHETFTIPPTDRPSLVATMDHRTRPAHIKPSISEHSYSKLLIIRVGPSRAADGLLRPSRRHRARP